LAKQQASEIQFSLGDEGSRRLFLALCRRYGLDPYLNSVTSKLITGEVYADTSEAAEVDVARLSAG